MKNKLHRFYPENYDLLRPDNNILPNALPNALPNGLPNGLPSYNMLFNTGILG